MSPPASSQALDRAETLRYGRHLVLPEVGVDGQQRLKRARVLLVGMGGLGSPAGLYLAAAGVGTLGLVDFDRVEASNLQRQVLFAAADVGRPKVAAAAERLGGVNPHIELVHHEERLGAANVRRLVAGYDLVVDGSDNFVTRYLVNDACVLLGKPDVWGAVLRFDGQVAVFGVSGGPCYRCLFPEPPPAGSVPSCAEGGVLGVLPGIIGSLQANEAIKLILGVGEPLVGRLLTFDALRLRFREVRLPRDPGCRRCGDGERDERLVAVEEACAAPSAGLDEEMRMSEVPFEIDVHQLRAWLDEGREVLVLDVREPHEAEICKIEGAQLLRLGEIPARYEELDREQLIVAHCHHGGRSAQAVGFLRQKGFDRATNLAGGIDAWSREIDDTVARY